MHLPHDAMLLRIFLGESDRWDHKPLYEAIVLKAREMHLAGATVLRGPMGFGKSSRLHTAKILRLSMDLPMVIEIVDVEEKLNAFLPVLDEMMNGGLETMSSKVSPATGPNISPSLNSILEMQFSCALNREIASARALQSTLTTCSL